jgi:hypothetical protein
MSLSRAASFSKSGKILTVVFFRAAQSFTVDNGGSILAVLRVSKVLAFGVEYRRAVFDLLVPASCKIRVVL